MKLIYNSCVAGICVFLLSISTLLAQDQRIPFQGTLYQSGTAYDGTVNITFTIASPAWTETHNAVTVTEGIYAVVLGSITPFPSDMFTTGTPQMTVNIGGTDVATVDLHAPYISEEIIAKNMPGQINRTFTEDGGEHNGLTVVVDGTADSQNAALEGVAQSNFHNAGVEGFAVSGDGNVNTQYGVYGQASGTGTGNHRGVLGYAAGAGKYNHGMKGVSDGAGSGEEGKDFGVGSVNFGVEGNATGNTWNNTGVEGSNYGTAGKWNFGVHGISNAGTGTTVENTGVAGRAYGEGINVGVYGTAGGGAENYAGMFDGDVQINGQLTIDGEVLDLTTGPAIGVFDSVWVQNESQEVRAKLTSKANSSLELFDRLNEKTFWLMSNDTASHFFMYNERIRSSNGNRYPAFWMKNYDWGTYWQQAGIPEAGDPDWLKTGVAYQQAWGNGAQYVVETGNRPKVRLEASEDFGRITMYSNSYDNTTDIKTNIEMGAKDWETTNGTQLPYFKMNGSVQLEDTENPGNFFHPDMIWMDVVHDEGDGSEFGSLTLNGTDGSSFTINSHGIQNNQTNNFVLDGTDNENTAVYTESNGAGDGATGWGTGSYNIGLKGIAQNNGWGNVGVTGYAQGTTGTDNAGGSFFGQVDDGTSTIVNKGIYANASGPGVNYAIYAQTGGGVENWAGYFDGNVNVSGSLIVNGQAIGEGTADISGANGKFSAVEVNDPTGNDPGGTSGEIFLQGNTSPNFQMGGMQWENNDLPHFQMFGRTPTPDDLWFQSNITMTVGSDGTDDWGSLNINKTNISTKDNIETFSVNGQNGDVSAQGNIWTPRTELQSNWGNSGSQGALILRDANDNWMNVHTASDDGVGNYFGSSSLSNSVNQSSIQLNGNGYISIQNESDGGLAAIEMSQSGDAGYMNINNSANQNTISMDGEFGEVFANSFANPRVQIMSDWGTDGQGAMVLRDVNDNWMVQSSVDDDGFGSYWGHILLSNSVDGNVVAMDGQGNITASGNISTNSMENNGSYTGYGDMIQLTAFGLNSMPEVPFNTVELVNGQNTGSGAGEIYLYSNDGNQGFSASGWGDVAASGTITATTVTETSDARFKKNVKTIDNALAKTQQLNGYTYNWNKLAEKQRGIKNKEEQVGVLAQELEAVFPQLVKTDEEGYKSVNYAALTAVLIEAVKELSEQVSTLQGENQELKAELTKVDELEIKIDLIQKLLAKQTLEASKATVSR